MRAVVLAAGEGVRLHPLTSTRPKHMLPVGGKPLLEYTLQALRIVGIEDVAILVGYKGEKIRDYFGQGTSQGLRLSYIEQERPLGTANAIALAEQYTDGEDFLLIHGDLLLTSAALGELLRRHDRKKRLTMGVVPVSEPSQFGVVQVKDGKVKSIIEKPKEAVESNLINAGIYVLNSDIFRQIEMTDKSMRGEYEFTDTLQALLAKEEDVEAALINAKDWLDIGRPWNLLEANERVLKEILPKIEGMIEDGAHLTDSVSVGEGARIRSGAYLEGPVFVGAGSDVGPNCYLRPYTSLGCNVRVGNACEVKNSIIMQGTHIGHLSYVGDSVIGENCNFGAGTITANLRFDDSPVKVLVKDKVTDTGLRKLGAFFGDDVKTGIGALIMPGVKVGCGAWVGPNVVLTRDLEENTLVVLKQKASKTTKLEKQDV